MRNWLLRRLGLLLAAAIVLPIAGPLLLATSRAQPPGIPRPPDPPEFDPGPIGPGRMFEHVFTCGRCNRELGRSDSSFDTPPYKTCPFCGVNFSNAGWGRPAAVSSFRPARGVEEALRKSAASPRANPPNAPRPNLRSNPPIDFNDKSDEDFPDLQAPLGSRLMLAAIIGIVGLVGIAGLVGLVFLISRASSPSRRPRRRRRRVEEEYDDYEDEPRPRSRRP